MEDPAAFAAWEVREKARQLAARTNEAKRQAMHRKHLERWVGRGWKGFRVGGRGGVM